MTQPGSPFDRRLLVVAVLVGLLYGLAVRLFFGFDLGEELFPVMSLAFLFGVPAVLGFAVVAIGERRERWSWWMWIVLPWLPSTLALGAALLLGWEGIICIYLWLPLFVVLSTIGGLLAALWRRLFRRRGGGAVIAAALLAPVVAAPLEQLWAGASEERTVATSIDVAAAPGDVWVEIVEVPVIGPDEHRFAWTHLIGFPRPVAARALGAGVGALRHATFERGVLFVETITAWQPGRELAFSIRADPVPAEALDQHVTVGGPYFDVLEGRYRIEPLDAGRVRLHLASRHRLSTRFNFYSGLWTDFILRETQRYILEVVRRRAEAAALAR